MKWYYVESGSAIGPVTEGHLLELFRQEEITPETYVWKQGTSDWVVFRESELFERSAS